MTKASKALMLTDEPNERQIIPALSVDKFTATTIGLYYDPDNMPTFEEWERYVVALLKVESAVKWVLGDALNAGEYYHGEKYAQAIEVTGYAYGSISNIAWVCRSVPKENRREGVYWGIYQEIAPLDPEQQVEMLDLVEQEGLQRSDVASLKRNMAKSDEELSHIPVSTRIAAWAEKHGSFWYFNDKKHGPMSMEDMMAQKLDELQADGYIVTITIERGHRWDIEGEEVGGEVLEGEVVSD